VDAVAWVGGGKLCITEAGREKKLGIWTAVRRVSRVRPDGFGVSWGWSDVSSQMRSHQQGRREGTEGSFPAAAQSCGAGDALVIAEPPRSLLKDRDRTTPNPFFIFSPTPIL